MVVLVLVLVCVSRYDHYRGVVCVVAVNNGSIGVGMLYIMWVYFSCIMGYNNLVQHSSLPKNCCTCHSLKYGI